MPILSICLPTYNRSSCLRQSIQSLVVQSAFRDTDQVEIIISDNCSTDDTRTVAEEYTAQYAGKIKYFCNEVNVGAAANFAIAMHHAEGDYLKLYNDYLFAVNGFLDDFINVLIAVREEKPLILLTNGNVEASAPLQVCNTLDDLVGAVSYYLTWIASIGFWKSEFSTLEDHSKYLANTATHLPQTHYLLNLFQDGKRAIVLTKNYFLIIDPGKKSGYNVAEVFGRNYLSILKKRVALEQLSDTVYQKEKRDVLLKYILPNYFDKSNNLTKAGFFRYMEDYIDNDYFYDAIENLLLSR